MSEPNRGGVGVRLSVRGGDLARKEFAQLSTSGRAAFTQLATSAQQANVALVGVSKAVDAVGDEAQRTAGRLGLVGTVLSGFGPAAVAAAAGLAVLSAGLSAASDKAATFEFALDSLQSNAALAGEANARLGQSALALGDQFNVGATAAAGVMEEIIKAGADATEVMDGAAAAALAMAQATGVDAREGASVAAQAMNLFNLRGSQMAEVANASTAFVDETRASLNDLALALGSGGAAAAAAGLSLNEFIAIMANTVDGATSGGDAATAFAAALRMLRSPTDESKAAFREMQVAIYDATGTMRPIIEVLADVEQAVSGLTDQDRNRLLQDAFGTDAMGKFILPLFNRGVESVERFQQVIADTSAVDKAAQRTDNLRGSQANLRAEVEELSVALGDAGLTSVLRGLTDALAGAAAGMTNLIRTGSFLDAEAFGLGAAPAGAQGAPGAVPDLNTAPLPAGHSRQGAPQDLSQGALQGWLASQGFRPSRRASRPPPGTPTGGGGRGGDPRAEVNRALSQAATETERFAADLARLAELQARFPTDSAALEQALRRQAAEFGEAQASAGGLGEGFAALEARDPAVLDRYSAAVAALTARRAELGEDGFVAALARETAALQDAATAATARLQVEQDLADLRRSVQTPAERAAAARDGDQRTLEAARKSGALSQTEYEQLLTRVSKHHDALADSVDRVREAQERGAETFRTWVDLLTGLTGGAQSAERAILALGQQILALAADRYADGGGKGGFGSALGATVADLFGFGRSAKGGGKGARSGGSGLTSEGRPTPTSWTDFLFPGGGFGGGGRGVGGFDFGGWGASGVDTRPGFYYRVAEAGRPELFVLGGQGQVVGLDQTADLLAPGVSASGGRGPGGGRLEVVVRDESQGRVGASVREGADGTPQLDLLVRQAGGKVLESGGWDAAFARRFGLRPVAGF